MITKFVSLIVSSVLLFGCNHHPGKTTFTMPAQVEDGPPAGFGEESRALRIIANCPEGMKSFGSGFILQPGLVGTAKHIVDAEECQYDVIHRDETFKVEEILYGEGDTALLKVTNVGTGFSRLNVRDPYRGEHIRCWGYPWNVHAEKFIYTFYEGYVMAINVDDGSDEDGIGTSHRVSSDFFKGASGSACYGEDGSAVGAVSFMQPVFQWSGEYYVADVSNIYSSNKKPEGKRLLPVPDPGI